MVMAPVAASLFLSTAIAQQNPVTPKALPRFEDYPAAPIFTGKPAKVNLASNRDARRFRTALTEAFTDESRFAGHYRVVEIGCGASCQSVWAVDLIDGSIYSLFTASYGSVFRPDSRLIVKNDPEQYEEMLKDSTVAEVESMMKTYGPPEFWLEEKGKFKRIGPYKVRLDPVSKKVVANATGSPANASAGSNTSSSKTTKIKVFLVAGGDNGKNGKRIGCDDSLVAVSRTIERTAPRLRAALDELLSMPEEFDNGGQKLGNYWKGSDLKVKRVSLTNGTATIQITGRLLIAGICDEPRIEEQIQATAKQFPTVKRVRVFVNGTRLKEAIR